MFHGNILKERAKGKKQGKGKNKNNGG